MYLLIKCRIVYWGYRLFYRDECASTLGVQAGVRVRILLFNSRPFYIT